MALHLTITRGYTMQAGVAPTVADWNAAFLPNITLEGGVTGTDIEASSVTSTHLNKNVFSALTTATAWTSSDKLPFYSAGSDANQVITVGNALNSIFKLAPEGLTFTAYATDYLTYYNGTSAARIPIQRFSEQQIGQATELTSTADGDQVLVSQTSADVGSKAKRVSLANILPDKATAGAYVGVTGITIDAKGRVTNVTATGGSSARFTATGVAVPSGVIATSTPATHGLGSIPTEFSAALECTSASAGYAAGDLIPLAQVFYEVGGGSSLTLSALVPKATLTSLIVTSQCDVSKMYVMNLSASPVVKSPFDPTKWSIRWSAWK